MAKRMKDTDKHAEKKILRLRFKKMVRIAAVNQDWIDDREEQPGGFGMNAKKNVAFLIRPKRKIGILTVAEKALLRSSPAVRTIDDRQKLCKIVANLPCFSDTPPKLRVQLLPYLRFITLGPDRTVIREGDNPLMVYFMVSGEVEKKKSVFDKNSKKFHHSPEAVMGAGDTIGDAELLEGCLRISTYVTISTCEMLSLTSDEYFHVLGDYHVKLWRQKKIALRSLSYFDYLTGDQLVRACSYCHLVKYNPMDSIYSEDKGATSCVHFILSGECAILQCLQMQPEYKNDGTKTFQLSAVKETETTDFTSQSSRTIKSMYSFMKKEPKDFVLKIRELLASSSDLSDEEGNRIRRAKRRLGLRDIEMACGAGKIPDSLTRKKRAQLLSRRKVERNLIYSTSSCDEDNIDELPFEYEYMEEYDDEDCEDASTGVEVDSRSYASMSLRHPTVRLGSQTGHVHTSRPGSGSKPRHSRSQKTLSHTETVDLSSGSSSSLLSFRSQLKFRTETRFMDVGSLTFGGIFGLGENITHRVIMARTVVQCLLLPRYWMMEPEQNPGNIWQRRRFYLERSIPSREELFGNFMKSRNWDEFKSSFIQSTLSSDSALDTKPEDIPIICRIVETREDV